MPVDHQQVEWSQCTCWPSTSEAPRILYTDVIDTMKGSDDDNYDTVMHVVLAKYDEHCDETKFINIRSDSLSKIQCHQEESQPITENESISWGFISKSYDFPEVAKRNVCKDWLSLQECHCFLKLKWRQSRGGCLFLSRSWWRTMQTASCIVMHLPPRLKRRGICCNGRHFQLCLKHCCQDELGN